MYLLIVVNIYQPYIYIALEKYKMVKSPLASIINGTKYSRVD